MPRTRQEQREHTREVLLDATMRCLVSHGYAGTTTQRIQEEAGVSRGALLHHFATKADLLVASIHHIADIRLAALTDVIGRLAPGPDNLAHMVRTIREQMAGPPFQAAIELWVASRTDEQLRDALLPAERQLGAAMRDLFNQHSGIPDPDAATVAFESLLALVRGLELTRLMRKDETIATRVVQDWLDSVDRLRQPPEQVPGA